MNEEKTVDEKILDIAEDHPVVAYAAGLGLCAAVCIPLYMIYGRAVGKAAGKSAARTLVKELLR